MAYSVRVGHGLERKRRRRRRRRVLRAACCRACQACTAAPCRVLGRRQQFPKRG
jgi:hypothetical protein